MEGKLPSFITIDKTTYQNAKHKARFIDELYGEWWDYPSRVAAGKLHPKRSKEARRQKTLLKIKSKLPTNLTIDDNTFKNTHEKAKFVDVELGEFWARPDHIMKKPAKPKPARLSVEDVQKRLPNYVTLDINTYKNTHAKCRFIDSEHGEWWAIPSDIMAGRNHPKRARAKFLKSTSQRRLKEETIQKRLPEFLKIDYSTFVNVSTKAKFIDSEYGEFWARPDHILSGSLHPNRVINGSKIPIEKIKKCLPKNVKIDESTYVGAKYKARFIDEQYGECWIIPFTIIKIGYKHPNEGRTRLEKTFAAKMGINFYNQKLNQYRPDFKITDKVFVNVDGLYWHCEKETEIKYHFNMRKNYQSWGLRILQFYENEIYNKWDIVKSIIDAVSGNIQNTVFARKCQIKQLSTKESTEFFNNNHLMGSVRSRKTISLVHNNNIVAALAYSFHKQGTILKVDRFCLKTGVSVIGGLSKLQSYLIKNNPQLKELHSWVDLRYGDGHSLEKLGFTKMKETLGWKWTDYKTTYNRLKCRANMDSRGLSEKEHAEELGWSKIYDAGQALFVKIL